MTFAPRFRICLLLIPLGAACQQPSVTNGKPGCDQDFLPIAAHKGIPSDAVYANPSATASARAADVVHRLTFEEKLALTGGYHQMYFPGIRRLGVPAVYFADASQGVHEKITCVNVTRTTAFPDAQSLAATWDTDLASRYAAAIGEECRAWGISVLLGPGLNLYRNSEGGRNFEYFGEDPFLASRMGVAYVKGMQGVGTIATVKHFLGNEQEFVRHVADAVISERPLRELYLPPFEAAIREGGALAVMTGNNLVNGWPGAADKPLSQGVLRDEYGFQGVIMSDWANSIYWKDRVQVELGSGHSLLMADNAIFADWIHQQIAAHPDQTAAIEADLGKMAEENLYSFFKMGVYDRPFQDSRLLPKIEDHQAVARQVAEEAITLLKNDGNLLPLEPARVHALAVVGSDEALTVYAGKGSGAVKGYNHVDFMAGLKAAYGDRVQHVESSNTAALQSADAVLYFAAKDAGENFDVPYELPRLNEELAQLAALNKNIVVIYSGGNGVPMPWLPKVKAVVFAYLLGQQRGTALTDVLTGKANPSGRLPFTIEASVQDSPTANFNTLPDGTRSWSGSRDGSRAAQKFGTVPVKYSEGIYIGYRWYDREKKGVLFPFGYGLSYTTFRVGGVKASADIIRTGAPVLVQVTVTNTGRREGSEVVQLYVHPVAPAHDRPEKELKAFARVTLAPGASKTTTLTIQPEDLRYWDDASHGWKIDPGVYDLLIATSAGDVHGKARIRY